MSKKTIPVRLADRSYKILVERGSLTRLAEILDGNLEIRSKRIAIISDRTVFDLYGAAIRRDLTPLASGISTVILPPGEPSKTFANANKIVGILARDRMHRGDWVLALGGGVIGDMAGFVAAIYMRGVPVIHVPTTLLAQIDSSIGGKTGVNHSVGKNLIGAFHQPALVVTDPAALRTLPDRELRSGLYEAIKYGCILRPSLFRLIETHMPKLLAKDSETLEQVIAECARLKAQVVEKDERESGLRAILNFGHTAGHAVETVTRYRKFTHGEAVGFGMIVAGRIAQEMRALDPRHARRIEEVILSVGPLPSLSANQVPLILRALLHDKKIKAGKLSFVLPRALGRVELRDDVPEALIRSSLHAVIAEAR